MMQPKKRPALNSESRFSKAPPGYSLTTAPGKWPWERPPELNSPAEAVDAIIANIEQPEALEQNLQLLLAGVSVEEIVGTISRVGFMEGKWTADVAELIKGPLAIYFMGLGTEHNIPTRVYTTPDGNPRVNYGMEDTQILQIMRDRNPEFAHQLQKKMQIAYRERTKAVNQQVEKDALVQQQSFLGVDPIEGQVVEGDINNEV
jgi:hypothetical protein